VSAVPIRAVSVCVDYGDILSLTVPYNRQHFTEHWIITTPEDSLTQEVARRHDCKVYLTNEFFHKGAEFAKWRALEMALDDIGRSGWMLMLDADICWPQKATDALATWYRHPQVGTLYCPNRRMLEDQDKLLALSKSGIPPESHWSSMRLHANVNEWAGYSLLLHADDPALPQGHWHDTNWRSCGGADSFLQQRWTRDKKVKLPFEVLHIGSDGLNWYGRATPYLDGRPLHPDAEARKAKYLGQGEERKRSGFTKERIE